MIAVTGPLWLHIARMLIVVLIGSSAMFLVVVVVRKQVGGVA
jgi:hypothetical protein